MYQFRPVSERIESIRKYVRDREVLIDAERAEIVTEFFRNNVNLPPEIKLPSGTLAICSQMTCRVEDLEVFVGNIGKEFLGSGMWPDWDAGWLWRELEEGTRWTKRDDDRYYRINHGMQFIITQEEKDKFMPLRAFWQENSVTSKADSWSPDGFAELEDLGVMYGANGAPRADIPTGHLIPGHEKILKLGYGAIRRQAQDWMDAHKGNLMGEDMEKYMFYKSVTIVCDAAITLIKRYADACREKAENWPDPARKAELLKMSEGLDWLSENPARTFWEALQGTLLYHLLLILEARPPALAFGRIDQYTWPYLKADLEAKRITMDEAQELLDFFFLKSGSFWRATQPELARIAGVGVTSHHTTLGGVDRETGEDATNPVTFLSLESMCRLTLHDPPISLRINKDTPDDLWELAVETTRLIGGLPLLQNDEVIIPGMVKELGFEIRDARDYGIIGCQEIVGCGTDYSAGNGIHGKAGLSSHGNVLNLALNNGTNPFNGAKGGLETGHLYDMKSFEEVKEAYKKQFAFLNHWAVTMQNYVENITMHLAPEPGLSISMEGCMENGRDCTKGGAKYNSFGGTATGLSTVADSLTTIKYMVFDKKLCSARELYDAFMANWEGYEVLRQQILKVVPHYGNGDPYADEQMKWVVDVYYDDCKRCFSTRTGIYKAGLYGAASHVVQGEFTGATPDGRKDGQPLADATSPGQGRDRNGPIAILNSARCFEHGKFMDGIALNIRIHPTTLNGEGGKEKLRDMTKSYFRDGGMEVQYNVVSSDTLKEAQKDPGSYRNLVVRVAGYSAYFTEMTPELQSDIISRTEHSL